MQEKSFSYGFGALHVEQTVWATVLSWVSAVLSLFPPSPVASFYTLTDERGSHCSVSVCLNRQSRHDSQEPGLRQPQRHLGQTGKGSGEPTMRRWMDMFVVFLKDTFASFTDYS